MGKESNKKAKDISDEVMSQLTNPRAKLHIVLRKHNLECQTPILFPLRWREFELVFIDQYTLEEKLEFPAMIHPLVSLFRESDSWVV